VNRIVKNETLAPDVFRLVVEAPRIAKKRKPGQFILLRVNETGERIPLTIADADPGAGTITLVVQIVGKTTQLLWRVPEGGELADVVGPLGNPTEIEKLGTVVAVGGGIGIAPLLPIARGFREAGSRVVAILGARTKGLLILEEELRAASDETIITTDDGSCGEKGFVSDPLKRMIESGQKIDLVVAIGPVPMMRAVAEVTRAAGIKTVVSLNPIMIDGTGMCGGCRVSVGGETKFACVDGPEFDGHKVDFAELTRRLSAYHEHEELARKEYERCRLKEV